MSAGKAFLILHGKQALNEDVRAAVEQQRAAGWELAVRLTWEAGDAQRLVREALEGGYTRLIAGGGDGTLRDICEAMALADTEASLVLLPLGTANDFARAAGVSLEPAQALALLDVPACPIDLGEVDGQLFLNMATGGFGSQVTANTSEDLKKVLGGAPLPSLSRIEPFPVDAVEPAGALGDDLRRREFQMIIDTLRAERGRRKEASERLGISPRTLRYKLAQMRDAGMDVEAYLFASG